MNKLTRRSMLVLETVAASTDEYTLSVLTIANYCDLTLANTREHLAALRLLGYVKLVYLMNDEGYITGRGYIRTKAGDDIINRNKEPPK